MRRTIFQMKCDPSDAHQNEVAILTNFNVVQHDERGLQLRIVVRERLKVVLSCERFGGRGA